MRPSEIVVERPGPGVAVVAVSGEHEMFSAPRLTRELETLIDEGTAIVVDLTQADFLDSAIVSVLLRARWDAQQRGCRLALVLDDSTGWSVSRLFEVTGLTDVFQTAHDRAGGIAAVRG